MDYFFAQTTVSGRLFELSSIYQVSKLAVLRAVLAFPYLSARLGLQSARNRWSGIIALSNVLRSLGFGEILSSSSCEYIVLAQKISHHPSKARPLRWHSAISRVPITLKKIYIYIYEAFYDRGPLRTF